MKRIWVKRGGNGGLPHDKSGVSPIAKATIRWALPFSGMLIKSLKSFTPVAKLGTGPGVLAAFPGLGIKSVKDLIALAKEKPGSLLCTASGVGSYHHLGSELFFNDGRYRCEDLAVRGGGQPMIDTIGGHSQIFFGSLIQVMPYIKSGQLKALGISGFKRNAMIPDVPTISEAGVPGYDADTWWGILAPTGTPQEIVDRLNKKLRPILVSTEIQKLFMTQGAEMDYMGPAEFGKFIESETAKWVSVAKKANIKAE